ncbi:MAG: SusC/RagA family TonB-linked outer membrane protein [Flavobacteriaceae bacterium]|nr:MAG: SusC/RagA family TonB-linked outer membrane protein [Flavobacteriaceae bacterium]
MTKHKLIYWPRYNQNLVCKLRLRIAFMLFALCLFQAQAANKEATIGIKHKSESYTLPLDSQNTPPETVVNEQQKKIVTGFVKDETGLGIPGVTILIKGKSKGTVTQFEGDFSIETSEKDVLIFSYIGMETQEITVGSRTVLHVVMTNSNQKLDEVVIVAYGVKKKVTITGAISSIGADELINTPTASISNMLAGSVSGLASVQYSGQPGEDSAQLYIRGIATLNSSSPLVLVDGVERSFTQLDPNEIENITILKDASSTAVFGVRGANGVILVTTRRGKEGAPKISLTASYSIQAPTKLGKYSNAKDYMTYVNETDLNDGRSLSFSQSILDIYDDPNRNKLLYPDTDWQKKLYNNFAPQEQYNINISGGSNRVRYFTSIGLFKQKGIFNGNDDLDYNGNFTYNRTNLRANLDIDMTKTTLVSVNIGGRIEKRNEPQGFNDNFFQVIREANPLSAGLVNNLNILGNPTYLINPRSAMDYYNRGVDNRTTNVLNLDFKLKQDLDFITDGLEMHIKGSYNSYYTHKKTRTISRASYMPWIRKDIPWLDAPATEEKGNEIVLIKEGDDGQVNYRESFGKGRDFYVEMALNYRKKIGLHSVSSLLMYNASRKYYQRSYPDLPLGYVGMVGRATYDYDNRYMVDFSIGYNGSEKFARERRYGLFPSVSAGWIVSKENFLKDNTTLTFMKLRASYGIVGADSIGRFLYLPDSYGFGGGYIFGGNAGGNNPGGAYEGSINNKDVTWETAHKQNYGIELRLFKSKLSMSADFFMEKRNDILIKRNTYPTFVAYNPPPVNQGRVDNKGMEFNFKWKDRIEDFKYNIGIIGSYSKNEVIYKDEIPNSDNPWTLSTGHPLGQPFGFKSLGFYEKGMLNNQDVDAVETQPTIKEGDIVYADINGDGAIDNNDMIALGYPNYPLFTAGLNMGCGYKQFSFSMNWSGATKVSRVLTGVMVTPLGPTGDRSLMQQQFDNRWTPETATTATLPRASLNSSSANSQLSSLWIKDASYVRLRNIRLGYKFESDFLENIGIKKMQAFLVGYNLMTFDKLGVLDPEIRTQGKPTYPLMKVYSIGLNLSL